MKGETLFISDLHLDASRPGVTDMFLQFLQQDAPNSDALYILGDLFEVWVGDDDHSEHNLKIIRGLKKLADSGTPVFVMHGNRDFLMGNDFAQQSNTTLLADPTVISLHGTPTLLMHGDLLCSEDLKYMEFRKMVRQPEWQKAFLSQPLEERNRVVRGLREESKEQTSQKANEIMDVTQSTVEEYLLNHDCWNMIHGHTHRPATHDFILSGKPAQRIVLGDWHEQGSVLRCTADGCELEVLDRAT